MSIFYWWKSYVIYIWQFTVRPDWRQLSYSMQHKKSSLTKHRISWDGMLCVSGFFPQKASHRRKHTTAAPRTSSIPITHLPFDCALATRVGARCGERLLNDNDAWPNWAGSGERLGGGEGYGERLFNSLSIWLNDKAVVRIVGWLHRNDSLLHLATKRARDIPAEYIFN